MAKRKVIAKKEKKKTSPEVIQLYWVLGVMVALIALFLVASYFFQQRHSFEYNGLTFTKELFGEIPVFHYYYYYQKPGTQEFVKYNLFLRGDPRKNDVEFEKDGAVEFPLDKTVYVSVSGYGLEKCEKASVAISSLATFLGDNSLSVKGATPRIVQSEINNLTYAECKTKPENPVIEISVGEETKIIKQGMCYKIQVANCEILDAVEKFEVESVLDARARV